MSHLVEVYAKDLGVKVGKPKIQKHYYPVIHEKYITFHMDTDVQPKQYDYWDVCLGLLGPKLKELGYKIIQVGGPKAEPIQGVDELFNRCTYRQTNYIISKSKLHLGIDSLPVHIASAFGIPIVSLYSHTYKETCYPYWSDPEKVSLLSPNFEEIKPSFADQEPVKRINEVKPESLAQAVLDKLNIDFKIPFKTVRAGALYNAPLVEIVPNFFAYSKELHNRPVNIRGDLHFDLNNIINWCRMCLSHLVIDEELMDEHLNAIKQTTKRITFKIKDLNKDYSDFFKKIKKNKIELVVLAKKEEDLKDLRLKYFDYLVDLEIQGQEVSEISDKTKFFCKKRFISQGKVFNSRLSANSLDNSEKFVLNDTSKQELESLYLYE